MTETLTLLQFQSPWQARRGFHRYTLDRQTGQLSPSKDVKAKKVLNKGKGGIDGLILKPAWPTSRSLCVRVDGDRLKLFDAKGGRIDLSSAVDPTDPAFSGRIAERGLYRRFTFEDAANRIVFSDLEGRLLGPDRKPFEIFPTTDFSPFARLVRMLDAPACRRKLIDDLRNRRFEYPEWSERGGFGSGSESGPEPRSA